MNDPFEVLHYAGFTSVDTWEARELAQYGRTVFLGPLEDRHIGHRMMALAEDVNKLRDIYAMIGSQVTPEAVAISWFNASPVARGRIKVQMQGLVATHRVLLLAALMRVEFEYEIANSHYVRTVPGDLITCCTVGQEISPCNPRYSAKEARHLDNVSAMARALGDIDMLCMHMALQDLVSYQRACTLSGWT